MTNSYKMSDTATQNGVAVAPEENNPGSNKYLNDKMKKEGSESGVNDQTSETSEKDAKDTKKKEEKPPSVPIMSMFRFADKIDWLFMIFGTLGAMVTGLALPSLMIVFGDMTDSFVESAKQNLSALDPDEDPVDLIGDMKKFAIYYTIIGFGVMLAAYIQVSFWLMASYRQSQRIRILLFTSILKQEVGWFDTHEIGELNTRISDDVNKIQEGIGDKLSNFFQWATCFVGGMAVGFVYGWKLTLVILSIGPLLVVSGGLMSYLTSSYTGKELAAYAKAGAVAEEVLSAIRTVVAFGGQEKECQRYSGNLSQAKSFGIRKGAINGVSMGFLFFIIFGAYALAFWYGGKLIRDEPDNYSAGKMMIVFFSVIFGAWALGNAAPNLNNFGVARGAAYTIWELIDRKSLIDSSSKEGKKPELVGNIEFRNLVFRYPSRPDVPVLNGLNLQINVGQTVALVGASGCGKSTTVQLIQRFYDPLEGSVCIDGTDIRELNIEWLRQHIGVVSQEPVLFATTIGENIRYGRDGVTQKEIEAAAKSANAHDFIMKLPQKYETLVGERGAQLSGGQKQRVAIARALVRDPKILLLDEATSALDTESESTVQAALDKAREGRTTIVVAHRLSTVRNADVIVGFRDGAAAETGTHDELMEKQGIYYKLVTNQTMDDDEESDDLHVADGDGENQLSRTLSSPKRKGTLAKVASITEDEDKDEEEEKLGDPSIPRILKINAPEWPYILVGAFGALLNGGSQPAFAILFAEVIGVFAEPDLKKQEDDVLLYSMLFLVVGAAQCTGAFLQMFMFAISGEKLTMKIRQILFKAILRQEIGYFDLPRNSTGALTTRLATDASAIQGTTGARLGTFVASLANMGTACVIGFYFSWKLTLVTLAFLPLIAVGAAIELKTMQGYAGANQGAQEEAGKMATEAIGNIRTVAGLTREKTFVQEYRRLTLVPYKACLKKSHTYGFGFGFTQAITYFAFAAIFYYGAVLVDDGELSFTNMFKVFSAIIFGAMALGQAAMFAPDYGKGKQAAARIFHLVDREPAIDTYSETGNKMSHVQGSIEFRSVKFCYPSRPSVVVLKELSFQAQPGQMVALVGSSGCGKSTTVQLLERFYDPAEGQVMIDGQDVTGLNVQWLRAQLGLVQQEPILFDRSIRENIAYGDNSRDVTMDEVITASRNANIHNFIDSLPNGYETNVGDKGAQLSGGQKQRVAIARALVRQPKILLLDEATSALDTESEKVVQEALDRAQEGRTSLVIAHRLSTIYNADCIIVFHLGQIAEIGTHSELMAHKGIYYTLNTKQQKQKQN